MLTTYQDSSRREDVKGGVKKYGKKSTKRKTTGSKSKISGNGKK